MENHKWVCIKAATMGPDLWECTVCGIVAKDFELDEYNKEGCCKIVNMKEWLYKRAEKRFLKLSDHLD